MDVYHYLLFRSGTLQIILAAVGAVVAWRAWHLCGRKTLVAFYLVRSLFLIVGAVSFADAVAFDLSGWYMHAQWMVSGHHLPGKDFMSPYSLGFNGLLALSVLACDSQFAIQVLFIVAELAGVWCLYGFVRTLATDCVAKRVVILFATSPLAFISAREAQDEPLLLLGMFASMGLFLRGRCVQGAVASFATFFFTKITAVFYVAMSILRGGRKSILTLLGLLVAYGVGLAVCGMRVVDLHFGRALGMDACADKNASFETPGNVWHYLPELPNAFKYAVACAALACVALMFAEALLSDKRSRRDKARAAASSTFMLVALMYLLVPACFPQYVLPVLPILYFLALDGHSGWRAALLCLVSVSFGLLVIYCDYDGRWMRPWLKVPFCVYYFAQYGFVLSWVAFESRRYLASPAKGVSALLAELFRHPCQSVSEQRSKWHNRRHEGSRHED